MSTSTIDRRGKYLAETKKALELFESAKEIIDNVPSSIRTISLTGVVKLVMKQNPLTYRYWHSENIIFKILGDFVSDYLSHRKPQ